MLPTGQVGRRCPRDLRPGQSLHSSPGQAAAPRQLALGRRVLDICQPFRRDPSATQAKLCRRIERHIKSRPRTGYGNSLSLWPNRTCQRTTTPPSAACATWSSVARSAAAPARARHTEQDDLGLSLRHLERPGSKSSRRLPSTAHFPATLNCYPILPSTQVVIRRGYPAVPSPLMDGCAVLRQPR